jgi:hypothetical protein
MPLLADRVKESTSTTGTGTLTLLGAYEGYQTFTNAFGNGIAVYYAIAGGDEWEVGIGTTGAGTLTRSSVLASSNGGALVPFSSGIKDVFCTYAAGRAVTTSDAATLTNKTIDDISNFVAADQVHFRIKANENIQRGNVLKVVGFNPGNDAVEVVKWSAASDIAVGLSDDTLVTGEFGTCVVTGELGNVDTNGFSIGTILYPTTGGALTATKPLSGTYQPVASVLRQQMNTGVLAVQIEAPKYVESTTNTGNTLVLRDGSGNFLAGTITANLSGNATTATSATTATTATTATNVAWSGVTSTPTTLSGYGITDGVSTSGSYANPSWITSLAWSKISGTPTTVSGYGITDAVVTSGSYANPSWITSLAGSKISGNITGNAANVTGTVAIANGGTGATDATTARSNLSVPSTSGSGASGTWGISISGNAATATSASSATTASQIDGVEFVNTGSNSGTNANTIAANGISYVTGSIALFGQTDGALYSQAYNSDWQHQIFGDYRTGQIAIRGKQSGSFQSWRTVLDSSNYTSYSPSLTGSGASGTWGIRITGFANAGSQRLYSTDAAYNYDSGAPYFGYLTYDGSRWLFQVSPATPAAVRVAYADVAGSITGQANSATITADESASGSTIVRRNSSGYIFGTYFNSSAGNGENPSIGQIWTQNTSDNYLRKSTPAHFISNLGLITTSNYSSYALPLSGGIVSGSTRFTAGSYPVYIYGNGNTASVAAVGLNVFSQSGNGAVMAFHRDNYYAVNLGLDSDNVMRIGGWSAGANRWQLDMSGNQTLAGSSYAYAFYGTSNVGGTGSASYHPSGIYSTGTNWLYGTMYLNNNTLYNTGAINWNNGFQISQGGANYGVFNSWVRVDGHYGIYSGTNSFHWYPNPNTYGSAALLGSRGNYCGITLDNSNGFVAYMTRTDGNVTGVHNQSYGWQYHWNNGAMYVGINSYGGNDRRVLVEDQWIGDKYAGSDGNQYNAYTRSYGFLDRDEPSSFYVYPNNASRLYQMTFTGRVRFEGQDQSGDGTNDAQLYFTPGGGLTIASIATSMETGFIGSGYPWNRQTGALFTGDKRLFVWQDVVQYYSDERLKDKVATLDGALSAVVSWTPFKYRDSDLAKKHNLYNDKVQVGLSAQEVQRSFPELVELAPFDTEHDNSDPMNPRRYSKSGEEYLTLNYHRLVPVLVQAIKELEARVAQLES